MAFIMKMDIVDVICDNGFRNTYANGTKLGYEFQVRLNNYRGHYLSCIKEFSVEVDGVKANADDLTFGLNGKEFSVAQLPSLVSEFWNIIDPAVIKVYAPGGLSEGLHQVNVTLQLRIPYLATPGSTQLHDYAILDSSGSKKLAI